MTICALIYIAGQDQCIAMNMNNEKFGTLENGKTHIHCFSMKQFSFNPTAF